MDEGLVDDTASASDMTAETISTDQFEIPGTTLAQNLDLQDKKNLTILGGQLKFHVDTALKWFFFFSLSHFFYTLNSRTCKLRPASN